MFRRIFISLITAGAAIGAAALIKKYTEKKDHDSDDTPEKEDDSINFINIDDDDDEDEDPVEQIEKEEAPVDIPIMSAEEEKPESAVEHEAVPGEKEYSPEIEEVAGLYPYLTKDFIAEQFSRNDAFNEQYPEDTLITISHKASFPDADLLEEYTKIAEENGYTAEKTSETENIIRRKMFTENGAILSDIYNVANQVACLKGTYEGYNIEE